MGNKIAILLLATSALAPFRAHAQTASPATAPSAGQSGSSIEEIVVTAQKRAERLVNVPVSMTVLSSRDLASAGITDLRGLSAVTPGLVMDQAGLYTQPTIRGVGSEVTALGSSSNVATYVDGFYQPSQIGTDFDLSNISQVEVLKGPQGTLFGRNATGGAVLVTTRDPSFVAGGEASISYRSFNDVRESFYGTTPITDTLAANLAVYDQRSDGFKTDLVSRTHTSPVDKLNIRTKLLFHPNDDLEFILTLQHGGFEDPAGAAQSAYNGNSLGNRTDLFPGSVVASDRDHTALNNAPHDSVLTNAAYLKSIFTMDWATLTSYTGVRQEKDKIVDDLDVSTAPIFEASWPQREVTYTQEFNLNSTDPGPFKWIAGFFYDNDRVDNNQLYINNVNLLGPQGVRTKAYATFGDVTYQILPDLYLTGGLRYSNEQQIFFNELPETAASYSHTWGSFNERAVLRYELSPNSNVYASYSNGFKSGAYNTTNLRASVPVSPETIDAYEIGYKTKGEAFEFDTSGYYYDYTNLQYTSFGLNGNGLATLLNAARAEIYGVEGQLTYKFSPSFDARLGGAWTHARYTSFPGAPFFTPLLALVGGKTALAGNTESSVNAAGNTLVRAPDFSGTVGVDYKTPLPIGRLVMSGNVFFSSKVFFDPANQFSQGAYATLSLKATWVLPGDAWSISVFGDNITDTNYITQITPTTFDTGAVYGQPAVYGAELSVKF